MHIIFRDIIANLNEYVTNPRGDIKLIICTILHHIVGKAYHIMSTYNNEFYHHFMDMIIHVHDL